MMMLLLANLHIPANPSLGESLKFQFTGLLVVMTVLASIWMLITLMGVGFRASARRAAAAAATAKSPDAASSPTSPKLAPETIAVIAAAVHVTCGPGARIAHIAEAQHQSDLNLQAWSVEGRRNIFSSHRVR